jgi:DNA topoisomerase 2-associated protein PAT1
MLSGQVLRTNKDAEARTETFLSSVVPVVVQLVGRLELKMVAGMVSLCAERWDVSRVLATRPGVALFTILFSRAEMLKHVAAMPVPEGQIAPMVPSQAELDQWNLASTNLLRNLIPKLPSVFPSTQAQANAFGPGIYMLGGIAGNPASEIGAKDEKEGMKMDLKDGEVWGLIASFGLQAPPDEQTLLVSCLRDKVSLS